MTPREEAKAALNMLKAAMGSLQEGDEDASRKFRDAYIFASDTLLGLRRKFDKAEITPEQRKALFRVSAARARAMKPVGSGRGCLGSFAMQDALIREAEKLAELYDEIFP